MLEPCKACRYCNVHSKHLNGKHFGSSITLKTVEARLNIITLIQEQMILTCLENYFELFKDCVCYILASLVFKSKGEHLWNKENISLQKLFSFSRKSNFRMLDIQISWRNQIPKHKTRNTFYWITWEINTMC